MTILCFNLKTSFSTKLIIILVHCGPQSRKIQENGWKPKWFQRDGENGTYRYMGGYWESKEQGKWDGCPNIFGEFNGDLIAPLDAS